CCLKLPNIPKSSDSLIPFVIVKKPLRTQEHLIAGTRDGIDAILVESEGTTMTGSLFCNCCTMIISSDCRRSTDLCTKQHQNDNATSKFDVIFAIAGFGNIWEFQATSINFEKIQYE
ncbi:MAG: hypothetical protein EZS28_055410, partial [Streblomastix strix]